MWSNVFHCCMPFSDHWMMSSNMLFLTHSVESVMVGIEISHIYVFQKLTFPPFSISRWNATLDNESNPPLSWPCLKTYFSRTAWIPTPPPLSPVAGIRNKIPLPGQGLKCYRTEWTKEPTVSTGSSSFPASWTAPCNLLHVQCSQHCWKTAVVTHHDLQWSSWCTAYYWNMVAFWD